MKGMQLGAVLIFSCLLGACATGTLYESLQSAARNQCDRQAETDRAACLSRNNDRYDAYQKKRDDVLATPNKN